MFAPNMLLSALALTLLAVTVETGSGRNGEYSFDLSGAELTDLYNSAVYLAERMRRPKGSSSSAVGLFIHTGVRATLRDGSIHKGSHYGISSQTVVVDAEHMSSLWETVQARDFGGTKTVDDFVKPGGSE